MLTVEEMRLGLEQLKLPKETLSMRQYKLDLLQTEIMLQTLEQSLKKPVRRRKKAEPQLTLSTEIEAEKTAELGVTNPKAKAID